MIIKTKDFAEVANKIKEAVSLDENAANLEVVARGTGLFLNVTNREFYVSVKYDLAEEANFAATVDASLFLDLVSQITTETFNLAVEDPALIVTCGKSKYKLPMIYDNDKLMSLPVIKISNKTVEMPISFDILDSILNVNSKELAKVKKIEVNELQKMYYIDETGCFTFTTGACVNSFTLEKPVKLLLNEKIVKLFKLFKDDVLFSLGQDPLPNGTSRTKITLETSNVYLAAVITSDDDLINKVQGPCIATKRFINETYAHHVVLSAKEVSAAINRLMLFTKNSVDKANMAFIPATVVIDPDELIIKDKFGNMETITIENGSYVDESYTMDINLADVKLITDSCKGEHVTMNCGNHKSVVFVRGNISNLVPESKKN
jgi:DNA polymerase III sliding clamp (beta) subunit (PCNA family)